MFFLALRFFVHNLQRVFSEECEAQPSKAKLQKGFIVPLDGVAYFLFHITTLKEGAFENEFTEFVEKMDFYPPTEEIEEFLLVEEGSEEIGDLDELYNEAKEIIIDQQTASVSLLQRKLKIGYARAGRLIDQLEKTGVVGKFKGSKPREVLIKRER